METTETTQPSLDGHGFSDDFRLSDDFVIVTDEARGATATINERWYRLYSHSKAMCELMLAFNTELEPGYAPQGLGVAVHDQLSKLENLVTAARILITPAVAATGEWKRDGAPNPERWFAGKTGKSPAAARAEMETGKNLGNAPGTREAFKNGELSAEQADTIADAVEANPEAEQALLDAAKKQSLKELKDEAARRKDEVEDMEKREKRIHKKRSVRTWTDSEGAWNLHAKGTIPDGADFMSVLERLIDQQFKQARKNGVRGTRDNYAFDALMNLATQNGTGSCGSTGPSPTDPEPRHTRPSHTGPAGVGTPGSARSDQQQAEAAAGAETETETDTGAEAAEAEQSDRSSRPDKSKRHPRPPISQQQIYCIDWNALVRGNATLGERCELRGTGPVSVGAVRRALTTGTAKLVVVDDAGRVTTVAHLGTGPINLRLIPGVTIPPHTGDEGTLPFETSCSTRTSLPNSAARPLVIIGIQAADLGSVDGQQALQLLGAQALARLVSRGQHVRTLRYSGRAPNTAQRIALAWQETTCSVLGCPNQRVEIDHRVPWAAERVTELSNLDPLCAHHHAQKTNGGRGLGSSDTG